ncbi:MAG: sulfite exporter TauE/SafE family protein [Candidatus Omnitrophica bacterium]|nr:sulfite exporter TauE/SafE family protein [Candidatus Omnitrophota bacterium]
MNQSVSYAVAFTAGFLSYLSPCLLPLIPSFIAYISGLSFNDLKYSGSKADVRHKTLIHSILFILGFSIVFIILGLTATVMGKALWQYQKAIRIAGGALIVLFGLSLMGVLKIDFLMKERRLSIQAKRASYVGSFIVGVTFAVAWTPCAGPILGSILVLAGTKADVVQGAKLLAVYSAGIAVPFFLTALLVSSFLENFSRFKKVLKVINVVGGGFLVIVGMLVMTNYLTAIGNRLFSTIIK